MAKTQEVRKLRGQVAGLPELHEQLQDITSRHGVLLEMLGERDEEIEELRQDLQEVKVCGVVWCGVMWCDVVCVCGVV